MQTITVNLCVKKPKDYLNYHLSSFKVSENFPVALEKEVKKLTKIQIKQYKKIAQSFVATLISFLALSSKSMANTLQPITQAQITTSIPIEFLEPMMELIKLAIGGSVVLTVLLLILAGIMRQFRKKKEAAEWSTDIIKGFLQIMIATPLVFVLYYIVTLLLGNFGQFLQPFQG